MSRFSRIYVEITNMCNLSCSFCIGNTRPNQIMSVDEFDLVIHKIKPYTNYICMHVLGEPLMHPQLDELLALAHKAELKVNITTNGTLLAQEKEILLNAKALHKVSVSLHSLQDSDKAAEYLSNVADFALAGAEKRVLCDLRLWNINAKDINNQSILNQLCRFLHTDENSIEKARDKISTMGSITLAPTIFLGTAPRFDWPSMNAPLTDKAVFCYGLRTQAAILCDGTVVPCCLDSKGDINLGNIYHTPFDEIINSKRATDIYNGFSSRCPSEELCRRCGYATRF